MTVIIIFLNLLWNFLSAFVGWQYKYMSCRILFQSGTFYDKFIYNVSINHLSKLIIDFYMYVVFFCLKFPPFCIISACHHHIGHLLFHWMYLFSFLCILSILFSYQGTLIDKKNGVNFQIFLCNFFRSRFDKIDA